VLPTHPNFAINSASQRTSSHEMINCCKEGRIHVQGTSRDFASYVVPC
jgi:hypothetical protein